MPCRKRVKGARFRQRISLKFTAKPRAGKTFRHAGIVLKWPEITPSRSRLNPIFCAMAVSAGRSAKTDSPAIDPPSRTRQNARPSRTPPRLISMVAPMSRPLSSVTALARNSSSGRKAEVIARETKTIWLSTAKSPLADGSCGASTYVGRGVRNMCTRTVRGRRRPAINFFLRLRVRPSNRRKLAAGRAR